MMKFVALAAVATMCVAGQASAKDATSAQLAGVSGAVMVQQAGKMVSATNATALHAGDRVVAMKDGKAQVKFSDGCVVELKASNMVTVGAKSPCASGAGVVTTAQAAPAQIDEGTALKVVGYVVAGGALIWGISEVFNNDVDSVSP